MPNFLKLPIPFKDFVKHPVVATLYICLIVIGSLYVRGEKKQANLESSYEKRLVDCEARGYTLGIKVDHLTDRLMKSDSLMNRLAARLETYQELGKLK